MGEASARTQVTRKGGKRNDRQGGKGGAQGSRPDTLEWAIGAVSGAAVAAIIAFLLYQAIGVTGKVPDLVVESQNIEQRGEAYYVEFRALNRGGATAAGVTVEGRLMQGERALETRETTLDYVPAQSERSGALLFRNDPSAYRLQLYAKGYTRP